MSSDGVARDQLRAFIERIERMEEEKAAIGADIKEIYAEAKGNGFDTKVLRKIVTIRKQDANERMEQEALLELYMAALGMIAEPDDDDDAGMVDITPAPPPDDIEARDYTAERADRAFKRAAARSSYDPIGFDTDGTV